MALAVSCPRCGGRLRPPGLAHSQWICDLDGAMPPLYTARHVHADVVAVAAGKAAEHGTPLWCLWPLPTGWMVTGLAWAVDERTGVPATAIVCTGPAPLGDGPADVVLIAEEPGVGLGARIAGISGTDPGLYLASVVGMQRSHAKVKAGGHPTPMWSVQTPDDRCAYAGEAKGRWLFAVAFPAHAGYLLAETPVLHDLADWLPPELVYGAPSPHLTTTD
jgi:hypothetical protein